MDSEGNHDSYIDQEEWELLCPEEMEEAVDVLVGEVDWLTEDVALFIRLVNPVDLRLERHAKARFLFILFGPGDASHHAKHLEIGEAMSALLQDEEVVESAYNALIVDQLLNTINAKIHKLTVLPHIHKPTEFGLKKRVDMIREELAAAGNGQEITNDNIAPPFSKWHIKNRDVRCVLHPSLPEPRGCCVLCTPRIQL